MENNFHGLPPHKRFKLMYQEGGKHQEKQDNVTSSLCLPVKKRKASLDPPLLPPNSTAATYCLPAKKRVWALQPNLIPNESISPFDLNVEYNPFFYEESETAPQEPKNVPIWNKIGEIRVNEHSNEADRVDDEEGDDDGIVCAICQSTDGDPSDPIVFCDGCDLMVHTTCYGHPLIEGVPEGDWFCTQCLASQSPKSKDFSCSLCPVAGGALKPTNDGQWAHIVCALFVPEVFFSDPEGREGIDFTKVHPWRWEQSCYVCDSASGCVLDCSEPKCPLSFHITCGLRENLCIEYTEGRNKGAIVAGFCKSHTDLWKKQQQTGKFKIVARDKHKK
ncbi:unnamed protein product [Ilex paraguariensis]|uniref:Protein Jade-1 n=1 Tax=Ilex paraguariensis TaxID=185542 RepID=A0ABC8QNB0_9AQUA